MGSKEKHTELISRNPFSNEIIKCYPTYSKSKVDRIIKKSHTTWSSWQLSSFESKSILFATFSQLLRANKEELATCITAEMGKLYTESVAEVEKCAWMIEYYIENGERILSPKAIHTEATESYVSYQSLGPILGVMPWNFPFWQVLRFAIPTMMAGNTIILKHASNVQGSALLMEKLFKEAGFPEGCFQVIVVSSRDIEEVILNPLVRGVSLTGSEPAGRSVGSAAGRGLKKSVLELGGSDPFIVCSDANVDEAVNIAVKSRMLTSGQTCISAKRFLIHSEVYDTFAQKIVEKVSALQMGDPMLPTTTVAPLAKREFVDDINKQCIASRRGGAKLLLGEKTKESNFYAPHVLGNVRPAHKVFKEETFGPLFALSKFDTMHEAITLANTSTFGLGASIWTENKTNIAMAIKSIQAGALFVNGLVKSDPRLPFGGILNSGYGRELGDYGMLTFTNEKTVWVK